MDHALNLIVSGFVALSTAMVSSKQQAAPTSRVRAYLPQNTAAEAVASDMRFVGAQMRLATKDKELLRQSEFAFVA